MNKLDRILYLVAPVFGVIGSPTRREHDPADQKENGHHAPLTADELADDFSTNEDEANNRYNDKLIRVSGMVKSIQQNNSTQTIFLSTSSALCSVICHFDEKYKGRINQLKPWQPVLVKGVCAGILKHVVLERCELEDR